MGIGTDTYAASTINSCCCQGLTAHFGLNYHAKYLIYFNEVESQDKERQQPSIPTTTAVDQVSSTPSPQLQEQQHKRFNCFYCSQPFQIFKLPWA
jgi:hypothetical protein